MAASLYGAGVYGDGLYSADPIQEASVSVAVAVAFDVSASFAALVSASVLWSIPVALDAAPVQLAYAYVDWDIPVLIDNVASTVVVFGSAGLSVPFMLDSSDVYGGPYWLPLEPEGQPWDSVAIGDIVWTPISAPQV